MYVHIGGDYTLSTRFIVGIFDMDAVTIHPEENPTMKYLRTAELMNRLETITFEIPRSMVVTLDKVYLSPVSSATLRNRLEKSGSYATTE